MIKLSTISTARRISVRHEIKQIYLWIADPKLTLISCFQHKCWTASHARIYNMVMIQRPWYFIQMIDNRQFSVEVQMGAPYCIHCPSLVQKIVLVSQNELALSKTSTNFWTKEGCWIPLGAPICTRTRNSLYVKHITQKYSLDAKVLTYYQTLIVFLKHNWKINDWWRCAFQTLSMYKLQIKDYARL